MTSLLETKSKRRTWRRRRGLIASVACCLLLALVGCAGKISTKASYTGDFPDPSIVRVASTYYGFATQAPGGHPAIQRTVSYDGIHWTKPAEPEALKALPSWADDSGTWGPDVELIGKTWVMYYSAHAAGGRHCLSVATAAAITDQFVDNSKKALSCQQGGETIDPTVFVGYFGERYLLWKGPNGHGIATLFSQRLSANGLSYIGKPTQLLIAKKKGWTKYNIEAPSMIYEAGKYFLYLVVCDRLRHLRGSTGSLHRPDRQEAMVFQPRKRPRAGRRELLLRPIRRPTHGLPRMGSDPRIQRWRNTFAMDRSGELPLRDPDLRLLHTLQLRQDHPQPAVDQFAGGVQMPGVAGGFGDDV
jgi:hypothetical protein